MKPLPALNEPTTILHRPSALTITRLLWCVGALAVACAVLPRWPVAGPWLVAPALAVTAVLDGRIACLIWALALSVASDVMPPASDNPGEHLLAWAAGACVLALCARQWRASRAAWFLSGFLGSAAWWVTGLIGQWAAAGRITLPLLDVVVSTLLTGFLVAVTASSWARWGYALRRRGRA